MTRKKFIGWASMFVGLAIVVLAIVRMTRSSGAGNPTAQVASPTSAQALSEALDLVIKTKSIPRDRAVFANPLRESIPLDPIVLNHPGDFREVSTLAPCDQPEMYRHEWYSSSTRIRVYVTYPDGTSELMGPDLRCMRAKPILKYRFEYDGEPVTITFLYKCGLVK